MFYAVQFVKHFTFITLVWVRSKLDLSWIQVTFRLGLVKAMGTFSTTQVLLSIDNTHVKVQIKIFSGYKIMLLYCESTTSTSSMRGALCAICQRTLSISDHQSSEENRNFRCSYSTFYRLSGFINQRQVGKGLALQIFTNRYLPIYIQLPSSYYYVPHTSFLLHFIFACLV